ncbi:MAG: hypothetical protein ACT4PT_04490 [Methanobacteriota archaeon]
MAWNRLEAEPAERVLVLLGGGAAVAIGVLAFAFDAVGRVGTFGAERAGGPLLTFVIDLVFGAFLLCSYRAMARSTTEGSVLAIAFSIVLLAFGGTAAVIGGILGIIGGVVALLRLPRWTV